MWRKLVPGFFNWNLDQNITLDIPGRWISTVPLTFRYFGRSNFLRKAAETSINSKKERSTFEQLCQVIRLALQSITREARTGWFRDTCTTQPIKTSFNLYNDECHWYNVLLWSVMLSTMYFLHTSTYINCTSTLWSIAKKGVSKRHVLGSYFLVSARVCKKAFCPLMPRLAMRIKRHRSLVSLGKSKDLKSSKLVQVRSTNSEGNVSSKCVTWNCRNESWGN